MKKFIISGCITAFSILATITTALAQTVETAPIFTPRVGVRYTTEGAGYESFSSFEGFLPVLQTPGNSLTFLQGKVLLDVDSNIATNILLGHRFFSGEQNRVTGGYISYSSRDTGQSNFDQLGFGFESLGSWDLRFNAYLPLNSSEALLSTANTGNGFQGNSFILGRQSLFQVALSGVDAEVGTRLAPLGQGDLRGFAGVYYYSGGESKEAFGWRTRVEARPTDYLNLGLSLQNDDLFDTRLVFTIGANFPGSSGRGSKPNKNSALLRMAETVERQATILVTNETRSSTTIATGTDGQPLTIIYVTDNGTGNGTFESPFGKITDAVTIAKPNNIIYVLSDTSTTFTPFKIPDGVQVLSSGILQTVNTQQFGLVTLPLSGSGIHPIITGSVPSGEGLVTLGNNSVLSGFNLQVQGSNGARAIQGTGISDVKIEYNKISNAFGEGIYLENIGGTATINSNTINSTAGNAINLSQVVNSQITNNTITNSGGQGIQIANASGTSNISGNTITNSTGDGIQLSQTNSTQITNNTITNPGGEGIQVVNANGNSNVSGNTINNATGKSIQLSQVASTQVNNNNISKAGSQGILLENASGTSNITLNTISDTTGNSIQLSQIADAQITNNIITNSGGASIDIINASGTSNISLNTISQAAGNGIQLFQVTSPTITNNSITNAGNRGIAIEIASGSTNISNNTFTDAKQEGINLFQVTGTVSINQNAINGSNNATGIEFGNVTGDVNLTIANNQLTENFNDIRVGLEETTGTVQINNNIISNNGTAIDLQLGKDTNLTSTTINNNQITGTETAGTSQGINLQAFDNAAAGNVTVSANTINNMTNGNGMNFQLNGTSTGTFNISNNIISNIQDTNLEASSLVDGIRVEAFDDAKADVTLANNNISQIPVGNGIYMQFGGGDNVGNIAITDNTISQITIQGNGIDLQFFDTSNINTTVNVARNNISDVQGTGINAANETPENTVNLTLDKNTISNTSRDGITLDGISNAQVINNKITNAGEQGIEVENANGNINVNSNTITDAQQEGIKLSEVTGAVSVNQNTVNGINNLSSINDIKGIAIANSAGNVDLTVNSNNLSENFNDIGVTFSGTASGTAQINDNIISNSGTAVDVQLQESANLTSVTLNNNQITGAEGSVASQGINFQSTNAAAGNVNVSGNNINRMINGDGMKFQLNGNSTATFTISGNTITNIQDFSGQNFTDGIKVEFFDTASSTITLSNNIIDQIQGSGISVTNASSDTINLNITGNQITNVQVGETNISPSP
ncbi:MAG TPA: right-handed parallel beta-helix repeat-containing protein [Nostocaceae cyanobacterium]|nr:right-handed parallel beta-helix repeat-containing protein [Nostocaceae cyanobacterium]